MCSTLSLTRTLYKVYEIGVTVFLKGLFMGVIGTVFCHILHFTMFSEKQWLVKTNTWLLSKQQDTAEPCGMQ